MEGTNSDRILDTNFSVLKCSLKKEIEKCASIVLGGGVIIYPTDTIYGIGCNPYNDLAVSKVFAIKGRDTNKSLPILASTLKDIENIVTLDSSAKLLAEHYWPGALTIIAPLKDNLISPLVHGNKMTAAVRIPANTCTIELLKLCRYIIGTSANISGKPPIKKLSDIDKSGLRGFDAFLDGGEVQKGIESTIVDVTNESISIKREGAIEKEKIYRTLGFRKDTHGI